jgi:hypothetical protein
MKHIHEIFAATFVFAGLLVSTGCDMARFAPGQDDDCHINSDYEIECGGFDPGLTQN